jgi:hypothetical protein
MLTVPSEHGAELLGRFGHSALAIVMEQPLKGSR